MSMQWHTYADAQATAEACAEYIRMRLEEARDGQERATLAISGGSSPKLLFHQLAISGFRWDRVHLFWVDERAVPPADAESNYRLAEENLIGPAHIPAAQIHRVHAEMPPPAAAQKYVVEIRGFFGLAEGEQPHFDVVHCGIGPDAHTASLFPGEPMIDDRAHIAAAVHVQKLNKWRITLLPGSLIGGQRYCVPVPEPTRRRPSGRFFIRSSIPSAGQRN